MEHCQGCLGWHREQAIFSPFTPSADSPSSLAGAATASTSTLRGCTWGGAATLSGMGLSPTLLACVCPGMVLGQRHHSPPPPPPSSPRMNFMAHGMSNWSPPGGYGICSLALPHLELHSPLMW